MLNWIPLLLYFSSKNEYSGEHMGMRYYFTMTKEKVPGPDGSEVEEKRLSGVIWPEPWTRDKTDPALQRHASFPFSEEGRAQAIAWIGQTYEENLEEWKNCPSILDCEPWAPPAEAPDDKDAQ